MVFAGALFCGDEDDTSISWRYYRCCCHNCIDNTPVAAAAAALVLQLLCSMRHIGTSMGKPLECCSEDHMWNWRTMWDHILQYCILCIDILYVEFGRDSSINPDSKRTHRRVRDFCVKSPVNLIGVPSLQGHGL
mmetsp:Transcript_21018/g.23510  ORF Transcript_21018/g.23510 Transcript_21018/m.23510 type:complete len:134 (-) Transcript_21018:99-500(-)